MSIPLATAAMAVLALAMKLTALVPDVGVPGIAWPDPAGQAVAGMQESVPPSYLDETMLLAPEPAAGPAVEPPADPVGQGDGTTHEPPPDPVGNGGGPASCPTTVQGLEDVAAELMQRRETLASREARLDLREAALAESETQLARRAEELEQLRRQLEQQLGRQTAEDDARIAQLVKVYEAMKAKQAAEVFDRLELDLLTRVASQMREAKMALVLAAMDPDKARRLTIELARRRSPVARGGAG
jgi:hypothetical protein